MYFDPDSFAKCFSELWLLAETALVHLQYS